MTALTRAQGGERQLAVLQAGSHQLPALALLAVCTLRGGAGVECESAKQDALGAACNPSRLATDAAIEQPPSEGLPALPTCSTSPTQY